MYSQWAYAAKSSTCSNQRLSLIFVLCICISTGQEKLWENPMSNATATRHVKIWLCDLSVLELL